MNGRSILKNGLMNSNYNYSNKQNIHNIKIGRCAGCGRMKVITQNNYKCPYCNVNMIDVDTLFKKI